MNLAITGAITEALDQDVVAAARLGGGDVADSFRIGLADGRIVFAKTHSSPPPGFFTTEARGLAWLREAGAVAVPEVLAVSDGSPVGPPFLVLQWIDEVGGSMARIDEAAFGRALAAVHRAGATCFGRVDRRTTGSRALPNDPCDTWVEFFASRRLQPLIRLAREADAFDEGTLGRLEWVSDHVEQLGGPPEPPARLHGDLWAGNRLVDTTGTSWIIDPAAHGGHREFDIAMMHLFGGFDDECFGAYHESFPLADGWRERIPLHQLAPLVVHTVKFGGGYGAATVRALDRVIGR
jgi:fructosamine-3-kinase